MPDKSLSFNAVFGVVSGYTGLGGFDSDRAVRMVALAWNEAMELELSVSGIQVSGLCKVANVVYPSKFGCPEGGEVVVEVTGVMNPKFIKGGWIPGPESDGVIDEDAEYISATVAWRNAVYRTVGSVKKRLQQHRVTLFFQEVESFYYLDYEEE